MVSDEPAAKGTMVAPLNAARTAQRAIPTTLNRDEHHSNRRTFVKWLAGLKPFGGVKLGALGFGLLFLPLDSIAAPGSTVEVDGTTLSSPALNRVGSPVKSWLLLGPLPLEVPIPNPAVLQPKASDPVSVSPDKILKWETFSRANIYEHYAEGYRGKTKEASVTNFSIYAYCDLWVESPGKVTLQINGIFEEGRRSFGGPVHRLWFNHEEIKPVEVMGFLPQANATYEVLASRGVNHCLLKINSALNESSEQIMWRGIGGAFECLTVPCGLGEWLVSSKSLLAGQSARWIETGNGWRFHTGDDLAWKNPAVDDHSWSYVHWDDNRLETHSRARPDERSGWFRKRLRVDPSLFHQTVFLRLESLPKTFVAFDVYFDGQLVRTGQLVNNFGSLGTRASRMLPIPLAFDSQPEHLLAVRYVAETPKSIPKGKDAPFEGSENTSFGVQRWLPRNHYGTRHSKDTGNPCTKDPYPP